MVVYSAALGDIGMVVTDLDGTLLDAQRQLSPEDRATLAELGAARIVRVVATGRSLYSARRVLAPDFPIDYLVHSSGAGVVSWPEQRSQHVQNLSPSQARTLASQLMAARCDFMLHHAVPDNHRFFAHRHTARNPDFERRMQVYSAFAEDLSWPRLLDGEMCQAVIIEPPGPSRHAEFRATFRGFHVVRATSPFDHASTWTEVFHEGVSKARAASWLCRQLSAAPVRCVAVGNDYNDLDLLAWADAAYVVANAPAELRARYTTVASHADSGFSQAVRHALSSGRSLR